MSTERSTSTAAIAPDNILTPDPAEGPELRVLEEQLAALEARHEMARLVDPEGNEMPLPLSALQALRRVLAVMEGGASIALVPQGRELTTRQAADLLHVSRPFLVRNLLGKEIPFEKVGSHHRIRMEDVLAYRERRARKRRRLLDEMTAEAEEMGEYD